MAVPKGVRIGGRQKGTRNKAPAERAAAIAASGLTPLDYMLNVLRRDIPEGIPVRLRVALESMRMDAAKAAAPYVHPKLANIELTGKDGGPLGVQVVHYSATQQMDAAALSNEGVVRTGTGLPPRRAALASPSGEGRSVSALDSNSGSSVPRELLASTARG